LKLISVIHAECYDKLYCRYNSYKLMWSKYRNFIYWYKSACIFMP